MRDDMTTPPTELTARGLHAWRQRLIAANRFAAMEMDTPLGLWNEMMERLSSPEAFSAKWTDGWNDLVHRMMEAKVPNAERLAVGVPELPTVHPLTIDGAIAELGKLTLTEFEYQQAVADLEAAKLEPKRLIAMARIAGVVLRIQR